MKKSAWMMMLCMLALFCAVAQSPLQQSQQQMTQVHVHNDAIFSLPDVLPESLSSPLHCIGMWRFSNAYGTTRIECLENNTMQVLQKSAEKKKTVTWSGTYMVTDSGEGEGGEIQFAISSCTERSGFKEKNRLVSQRWLLLYERTEEWLLMLRGDIPPHEGEEQFSYPALFTPVR